MKKEINVFRRDFWESFQMLILKSTSAFFKEDSQSYRIRAPQQMEAEGGITMPASPLVFLLAHIVGFFPRRALSKSWQDSHQHLQDSSLPTIPLSQG